MKTICLFLAALIAPASLSVGAPDAPPEGFAPLFNGEDLSGWKIP